MDGGPNKKKILLIDDDASLLLTLSDFLKFEGYEVMTADSGEQGLRKLARTKPDLIILDISMPGMGGIGFLKEISNPEGKPIYPVLVLTARANMAEFFANIAVDGFIAKPCDPNDLLMEVGRIIFLRSEREPSAPGGSPLPVRRRILVGEHDPSLRNDLLKRLTDDGYEADSAVSGPAVLEQAIVQKPDLIVVNQHLHDMSGSTVSRMLRQMTHTARIPILIYGDPLPPEIETAEDLKAAGVATVRGGNAGVIAEAIRGALLA